MLTGNGDVPHRECISSPGMGMCLTGNGDVPHRESTSSPGMHILTGNAHSLYRVCFFFTSLIAIFYNLFIQLTQNYDESRATFLSSYFCVNTSAHKTELDFADFKNSKQTL